MLVYLSQQFLLHLVFFLFVLLSHQLMLLVGLLRAKMCSYLFLEYFYLLFFLPFIFLDLLNECVFICLLLLLNDFVKFLRLLVSFSYIVLEPLSILLSLLLQLDQVFFIPSQRIVHHCLDMFVIKPSIRIVLDRFWENILASRFTCAHHELDWHLAVM